MSLSDPNLLAIEASVYQSQSSIDAYNSQIAQQNLTISNLQSVLIAAQIKMAAANDEIEKLSTPVSPLITQFRNIERMDGWVWPKGTQGNTGGTGNTGTATWLYDPVAGFVTAGVVPTLPKVPTAPSANYNAYFFNPLAGTDSNTGKPLAFPAIAPIQNSFVYHAEYFVDSANWGHRNALENEIRWHSGKGFRHIMASQLRIGAKVPTVHIYDWKGSPDKWVDTGVACNMKPGSWYSIDTAWQVDPVSGDTHCLGFMIEGQYHAYEHSQLPNPYTSHPAWFLASVQPDSNAAGDPFTYQVRELNVSIT